MYVCCIFACCKFCALTVATTERLKKRQVVNNATTVIKRLAFSAMPILLKGAIVKLDVWPT